MADRRRVRVRGRREDGGEEGEELGQAGVRRPAVDMANQLDEVAQRTAQLRRLLQAAEQEEADLRDALARGRREAIRQGRDAEVEAMELVLQRGEVERAFEEGSEEELVQEEEEFPAFSDFGAEAPIEEEPVEEDEERLAELEAIAEARLLLGRVYWEEHNQDMLEFLDKANRLIRTRNFHADLQDLRKLIQFLTGDDYDVFKFFAVTYRGIIANVQDETIALGIPFNTWKQNFLASLRNNQDIRIFRDFHYSNNVRREGSDILLSKLNAQQVTYAMKRAIDVYLKTRNVNLQTQVNLSTAIQSLFNRTRMEGAYPHPSYQLSANEVTEIWNLLFTILRLMRAIWANNILLPDLLLNQRLYREETYRGRVIRMIQAYPLLISNQYFGKYEPGGKEMMNLDTHRKVQWLVEENEVRDLEIKVRIKKVYTRIKAVNDETQDEVEERWRVITIDPLTWHLDGERDYTHKEARVLRSSNNFDPEAHLNRLGGVASATLQEFVDWFWEQVIADLKDNLDIYHDFELLPNGELDMSFILVDSITVVGRQARNMNQVQRTGHTFKTAFISSISGGWIRKMSYFSECSTMGICMYEALWTWRNFSNIAQRKRDPTYSFSYWKREEREKLMMKDFDKESLEVKLMCLHGNLDLFMDTFGQLIPILFWESEDIPQAFRNKILRSEGCFVVFDSHVFFANPANVLKELRLRDERESRKEDAKKGKHKDGKEIKFEDLGQFKMRPKYTKQELKEIKKKKREAKALKEREKNAAVMNQPDQHALDDEGIVEEERDEEESTEEDWFLDIETSIDKSTGKFTPYLICIVGEGQVLKLWGPECVQDFLEWVKSKVDTRVGVEVSHNHKPTKVNIWTYNGSGFDYVFLVHHLAAFQDFVLMGTRSKIKGIKILNVVFRDLLLICPFGSLDAQSKFWNTTKRKTQLNHEEITDAYIQFMYDNEEDVDVGLKKEEMISYCVNDCEVLGECVIAYKQWVRSNLDIDPHVISTAGLALRYWSTHHNPAKGKLDEVIHSKLVKGLPKKVYDKVKVSYKGGIVMNVKKLIDFNKEQEDIRRQCDLLTAEILKLGPDHPHTPLLRLQLIRLEKKRWKQYDINSSYPHAMKSNKIPFKCIGETYYEVPIILPTCYGLIDTNLYQVVSLKWKDSMRIPTIPKRTEDGLNHTTCHSPIDYIWGKELKFALETGWVESGMITGELTFAADYLFESYITELYDNRRMKCKLNGDVIGDKFYKLLLNSLYGKFGQKIYPRKLVVNDRKLAYYANRIKGSPEELSPGLWMIELYPDDHMLCAEDEDAGDEALEDLDVEKVSEDVYASSIGSCVHISSYIAALARINLMNGVKILTNNFTDDSVAYMDTDSCLTNADLPEDMVDKATLGKWGIDKDFITSYYAPAKKMYYLEYEGGKKVMKSKGITSHLMTKEDYIKLTETGLVEGKQGGDKWVAKHGYVYKLLNHKDLKVHDKRNYINNGITSMPLFT